MSESHSPHPGRSMRTRRLARCDDCKLATDVCICDLVQPILVRTPITLLVHHVEAHKTTNTARLAALAMGARSLPWGDRHAGMPTLPAGPLLLLFPFEAAAPIGPVHAARGATLVVPDGTWDQARRIANRVRQLGAGRCEAVRVEPAAKSRYPFRKVPRPDALSTFEAITEALVVLEAPAGDRVRREADALFDGFVERQGRLVAR